MQLRVNFSLYSILILLAYSLASFTAFSAINPPPGDGCILDLDIDFDNDNGFLKPEEDYHEENIEMDNPGKMIQKNRDDDDHDGIPDNHDAVTNGVFDLEDMAILVLKHTNYTGAASVNLSVSSNLLVRVFTKEGALLIGPEAGSNCTLSVNGRLELLVEGVESGLVHFVLTCSHGCRDDILVTVVDVDVRIQDLDEGSEETVGAILQYQPDSAGGIPVGGTNGMKYVSIICMPDSIPTNEMVMLSFPSGSLFELEGEILVPAQTNYPARDITSKVFFLHGHTVSEGLSAYSMTAVHTNSASSDRVKYKVVLDGSADSDGDGMPDSWERDHGFDPFDPADGLADADGDGLSNMAEYAYTSIMAWGANDGGQCNVPAGMTDAVAVAGGFYHSLALRRDGTVVAWGSDAYGQSTVPEPATNIIAVAAGKYHSLALRKDRTIVAWGDNNLEQCNVPAQATNVIAIASGVNHSLALRSDGSVVAWGRNFYGQCSVPASATNMIAVEAGEYHSLGLRADGTVLAWGSFGGCLVPASATNEVAIAAGEYQSLALCRDGKVITWGGGPSYGINMEEVTVTNAIAIASGDRHSFALRKDGTVVAWGASTSWGSLSSGQCTGATNVFSAFTVASGSYHGLAILRLNPNKQDTDGDGFPDGWEATHGANPLDRLDPGAIGSAVDSDADGMPDLWEILNSFDRYDPSDASQDADGDGLSNLDEYLLGTPPRSAGESSPPSTPASAPSYGPGQTGLLILTPSSVRN